MGLFIDSLAIFSSFDLRVQLLSLVSLLLMGMSYSIFQRGKIATLSPQIVGKPTGIWFPTWRARLRYISKGTELIQDGYQKVPLLMAPFIDLQWRPLLQAG